MYSVVGSFVYERNDLHLEESEKLRIIKAASSGDYKAFGKYKVSNVETIDGIKFHMDNGGWIMLRASGTEPLLRIYVEGNNREETLDMLEAVKQTIF